MTQQTVMFTALPTRVVDSNTVRLAVHVAPRLEPTGPTGFLSPDFPDFVHWAATAISFGVSFNGGAPLGASIVTDPVRDPARWDELFAPPAAIGVKGKPFPNYWHLPIVSYPGDKVADFLANAYTQLGLQSPDEPPLVAQLEQQFGAIAFTGEDDEKDPATPIVNALANERAQKRYNEFAGKGPEYDFLALLRFHRRPGKRVATPKPDFDFHELVALAAAHPRLLRVLGLVFDLEVSARSLPALPLNTEVQLSVDWTPLFAGTKLVLPRTAAEVDTANGVFRARPRDPVELERGQQRLANGGYALVTVDPDGGGLKALNFASSIKRSQIPKHKTMDTPERAAPPTLRSAGLAVVRKERGKTFHDKLVLGKDVNVAAVAGAAQVPNPAVQPLVYQEDVTRGFAVDVWSRESQQWHSIVRRGGEILFTGSNVTLSVPDDESALVTAATLPADPDAPDEVYLQPSLFQWFGWSLAVPPPGAPIHKNDDIVNPDPPGTSPLPIEFHLTVPEGSLPRLRYGVQYAVRMRAVDLAGGAIPFTLAASKDDPELVLKETYYRWEAIGSPDVALRAPRTEGESVERMVIRSDYVGPHEVDNERHLVPPKTAQLTAEQHGKYDTPTLVDETAYAAIVAREAKTLIDAGGIVDPDDPGNFHVPDPQLVLPYLPDPIVRGAAIRNLPGTSGAVQVYDFDPAGGTDWPDLRPFRIVVTQAAANGGLGPPAPPVFTTSDRALKVELPKAWVVRLRLSSAPIKPLIVLLALWQKLSDGAATPAQRALLKAAVEDGAHWLTSPDRTLTLVHAVRRPLKTPEWTQPFVQRQLGQTFATLRDRMTFSRKSTGKVEVFGAWTECIDNGPNPDEPPLEQPTENLALVVPLVRDAAEPPDFEDDNLEVHDRHEFGDTKHRLITYTAVATTKFGEYFLQREKHAVAPEIQLNDNNLGVIPESVTVRDAQGRVYTRGTEYDVNAPDGKILPLTIPGDKQLTITFLTPEITQTTVTPQALSIPSSARPPAPKLLYVVPTFTWPEKPQLQSERRRAGVRVYMERPWNVSGCDELLGVVLWRGPEVIFQFDPPDNLQPYVTRWGLDPVFASGSLPVRNPTFAQFPLATPDKQGLNKSLDELDALVHVAGHEVHYDASRDLMYSDVDIDETGSAYTPFIRLALARYQPESLPDAHLSRVVLADFIQLAPDRAVTVVPVPRTFTVTVTLSGLTYFRTIAGTGGGTARAILEQRDPSKGAADELGWTQVGQPVTLTKQPTQNPIFGIWSGQVNLPSARTPGKFRLVVEQFERLPTGRLFGSYLQGSRLVYSDIVPL